MPGRMKDYELPSLDFLFVRESWRDLAACRGLDPSMFFPERGKVDQAADAKAVCDECCVREECLEEALSLPETEGIRGGLSERVRRQIRWQRYRERKNAVAHGTVAEYGRGCRCDACKQAKSEYGRKRRGVA